MRTRRFFMFVVLAWITIISSMLYGQSITIETPNGDELSISFDLKHDKANYGSGADQGVQYFSLSSSRGTTLISADADTELGKWLMSRSGKRIRLTLETVAVQRLQR